MAMGNNTNEIQRRSYFKPSQKEGSSSRIPVAFGLKQMTVATRKAVKINR
jgi:hypothetical protein